MNKTIILAIIITILIITLSGCDKVNNASRTMDTMLGGDYKVIVEGTDEPYMVFDGKVTSTPKGYYVYYPRIDGEDKLVQSGIQTTTIIKLD